MPPLPPRQARRAVASTLVAAGAVLALAGCSAVVQPNPHYEDGWSAVHADGHARNAVDIDGPRTLDLQWNRGLGAAPTGFAASGPDEQLIVSARTDDGCQMFAFQLDNGRKKWCTWQNVGAGAMSPLVDQMAGIYVGNLGSADAFDVYGQMRWHTPVIGVPQPLQFLEDHAVVAVTHLGQVNVLNTTTGRKLAPSVELVPTDWPPSPDEGLSDCAAAGPDCPVAYPPAADTSADDIYVPFRAPDSDGAVLVAMHYSDGPGRGSDDADSDSPDSDAPDTDAPDSDADGAVTERWRSQPLPGGVASAPAISDDGSTIYVLDGENTLWALSSDDGSPQWSIRTGIDAGDTVSVSDSGLIVVGPAEAGPLVAVHDDGDGARISWRRDDLTATGPVAIAANDLGYVVTRSPRDTTSVVAVDLDDGHTVDTAGLDPRSGSSGVVVISGEGRAVVVGSAGLVSVFD